MSIFNPRSAMGGISMAEMKTRQANLGTWANEELRPRLSSLVATNVKNERQRLNGFKHAKNASPANLVKAINAIDSRIGGEYMNLLGNWFR